MWPCYRLVLERYASWSDLDSMTIDDVDLLLDTIDEWHRAEKRGR